MVELRKWLAGIDPMEEEEIGRDSLIQLKLFRQVFPGITGLYSGPQGVPLQNFIELHCEETNKCHLGKLSTSLKEKVKGKQTIQSIANKANQAGFLNISECLELTECGKQFMQAGQGGMVCVEIVLRCTGSFHDGKDSKSGKQRMQRFMV